MNDNEAKLAAELVRIKGVTVEEAAIRAHVMRPQQVVGVVSGSGQRGRTENSSLSSPTTRPFRGDGRLRQYSVGPASLGLAASPARTTGPAAWRGSIRGSATSCWGSSSWCATISSRHARRPCARPPSARSANDARRRDFRDAVPNPRHRLWIGLVAVPLVTALSLFALFPAAAANAWQRFLVPWKNAPRYTFTMLEPLSKTIVVPHGEPFSVALDAHE